ncbi:DUF6265 family protein [Pseudoalteromonas luteoviolacea]|uniref:DUF6265 domain-containing protein n=1 Tax=Pseudoalteromonas luteoviolacea H33 TaxID=1365251 RepID=A0A167EJ30_9GAMM|nr:DUF6265 family protein [Pseudoalteromonas luteoviolacea]KZN50809.1 hypothetical protein N476_15070 [Pseudoalteromonas luteoviolacea H33]KZN74840.1 hypothetical protein N477_21255 [Pseudoalteromonas luteoviolacea H33-S]MBQ4880573.1 hypothetical protein [Pseudoalteromonas luteoviolacea]MBQ4909609.1 hypothetical protein [Pseudoalteromonas luteoviolacea]
MFKFAYLIVIFATFNTSAKNNTCGSLESLSWLVGSWSSNNSKLEIKESWKKVSNKTFEGSGYTYSIKKSKKVSAETLRLIEMSGDVFYVAKVASNSLPIAFKLTSCTTETAIFENPKHDFPKKLTYQLKNENNITVAVTGEEGRGFSINFIREVKK